MNSLGVLIIALTIQETLLSHYAIFEARSAGINWIVIHMVWTMVTLAGLILPFYIGECIAKYVKNSKVKLLVSVFDKKIHLVKNIDNRFFLILLGIVNYVYLNAFVLGFLGIKSHRVFIYIFLGDLIWYLLLLSASLNGVNIIKNLQIFVVAFILVVTFYFIIRRIISRIFR